MKYSLNSASILNSVTLQITAKLLTNKYKQCYNKSMNYSQNLVMNWLNRIIDGGRWRMPA